MAMIAKPLTLSALAVELGKNIRTISRALKGVPPDGKSAGRDGWFTSTALKALGGEDGELNPAAERARLDKARADLAELDLAVKRGQLIPAELVAAAWGSAVTMMRTRLLSCPSSAAPRITGKMTTAEIELVIRHEIDEALEAIANAAVVQSADEPSAGSDDDSDTGAGEVVTKKAAQSVGRRKPKAK